jgi:nucleoid-associated protein YgaU
MNPGWKPAVPAVSPGLLAAPAAREAEGAGTGPGPVTVLAGDTLWDIAATAMGPGASDMDIAMQWPRWYEANRAVIGQDPDVLLPGQILQPPAAA